ncbi:MAG: c-type cytochrome, partial [Vicinamibacterales bacterium]
MKITRTAYLGIGLVLCLGFATSTGQAQQAAGTSPAMATSHEPGAATAPTEPTAVVQKYCATCHSERAKAGGLVLAGFDVSKAAEHAETAERMIRKLETGMMPPAGAAR